MPLEVGIAHLAVRTYVSKWDYTSSNENPNSKTQCYLSRWINKSYVTKITISIVKSSHSLGTSQIACIIAFHKDWCRNCSFDRELVKFYDFATIPPSLRFHNFRLSPLSLPLCASVPRWTAVPAQSSLHNCLRLSLQPCLCTLWKKKDGAVLLLMEEVVHGIKES